MPSLFNRNRNSISETPSSPLKSSSQSQFAPSPTQSQRRRSSLTPAAGGEGLLGSLKSKYTASKISLSHDEEGVKKNRRFSIGNVFANKEEDGGRRGSLSLRRDSGLGSGKVQNQNQGQMFPPGTTIIDQPNENTNRRSIDLLSPAYENEEPPLVSSPLDEEPAIAPSFQDVWKPMQPDRKGVPLSSPPLSPSRGVGNGGKWTREELDRKFKAVGANEMSEISPTHTGVAGSTSEVNAVQAGPTGSTSTSSSTFLPPPQAKQDKPRLPPGRITLPPPGLVSRKSTAPGFSSGYGISTSIVPSTPLPRPIANLPTLTPASAGSRGEAGYGFPAANGSASGPGTPVRSGSDARWAKKAMPVMLREPSHRPAAPVISQTEDGSDDDQESSGSDSSSEGDDDDDDSSEENHVASTRPDPAPRSTSLGGVGHRGLLAHRESVAAIDEETEEVDHSISERRQIASPHLGSLPENPTSPAQSVSRWGLPTPKTPGANSFFGSGTGGWTSFGPSTPMAGTPVASPTRPALGAFNLPNGVARAVALARGETPAAANGRAQSSYFETARPINSDGTKTPTPTSARMSGTREEEQEEDDIEVVSTPRAEEPSPSIPPPTIGAPQVGGVPPPLDLSSLPGMNSARSADSPSVTNSPSKTPVTASPAFRFGDSLANGGSRPTTPRAPSSRPGLYSQASRSMIDLPSSSTPWDETAQPELDEPVLNSQEEITTISSAGPSSPAGTGSRTASISGDSHIEPISPVASGTRTPVDWARPPPTPGIGMTQPFKFGAISNGPVHTPKQLVMQRQLSELRGTPPKRRRSLDDTKVKPPKYEPPEPRSGIPGPREEEGRENLPDYWCHVHIEGYLPRKMEFSAPGVQARDRSWKRYYFVLHGTCLRIYKHDTHKFPIKDHHLIVPEVAEEDLSNLHVHKPGEKREPVTAPTSVRPANAPATGSRRESVVEGAGAPPARRGSISSDQDAIGPAGRRPSASSMGSSTVPSSTASTEKEMSLFMPTAQPAARRPSVSVPPPAPSSGINARDNLTAHLPFGGGNALIKQYTLQNAESGLAADYVKKRNVVRLRVEGEQFLLQTDSARDVVDWIEAFQAATNVSLELDVRPMPKIITLPRRRRRRRPEDAAAAAQPGVAQTDDTPEGNARAVEQAERAAQAANARNSGSRAVNAMERMLAEDQAAA